MKLPKWPFDKFVYAKRTLGTQMKATGEVMAIGTTFEEAIMKAARGAEIGLDCLINPKLAGFSDEEIKAKIHNCNDERLFVVFEALRRGVTKEYIHEITKIDYWFLSKLVKLVDMEKELAKGELTDELYMKAKFMGYPDKVIKRISVV